MRQRLPKTEKLWKMKKSNLVFAFVFGIILVFTLCSCGPKVTLEEAKEALPALVEASKPLNEIYFGDGFEIDGESSDVASSGGYYCCDTKEYSLHSILEIKEATEAVFTSDYASLLYEAAFVGLTTDTTVKPPRFIEGEKGLMQRVSDEKYKIYDREFDYDSLEVKDATSSRITLTVDTYVEGKKDVNIEIILVRYGEEGSYYYRLDSPTY